MIIKHLCKRWFLVLGLLVFFCAGSMVYGWPAEDAKLFQSIRTSNSDELKDAIKVGANVNLADQNGMTVLMMASAFGQVDTVKVLLTHGADVNAQDQNGNTALINACQNNRLEIVRLLLEKKADVNLKNQSGDTALMIALDKGVKEVSQVLMKSGARMNASQKMIVAAIRSNNKELYNLFQEEYDEFKKSGGDVNEKVNAKLDSIKLNHLDFRDTLLPHAVSELNKLSKESDAEREGVKFILPVPANEKTIPQISLSLKDVTLRKALDELCKSAGFQYRIDAGQIIICKDIVPPATTKKFQETAKEYNKGRNLKPFQKDKKWGFVDEYGNVMIKPQFDKKSWGFWDGQAVVVLDKKYGIIDPNGNFIIKPQFENLKSAFQSKEDIIPAKSEGKWGFIDSSGDFTIKPRFDDTYLCGFIPEVELVPVKNGGKWGLIDRNGKFVVEPRFEDIFCCFTKERSLIPARLNGKWGFIDKAGNFAINPRFEEIRGLFDERTDLAAVKLNGKYGFINKTGQFVIPPKYDTAEWFFGSIADVRTGGAKIYIDRNDRVIIDENFEEAYAFTTDGFARAKVKGKWGLIDMTGQFVIEPLYEDINEGFFDNPNDLPKVKIGKNYFKVDRTGKIISPLLFTNKVNSVMSSKTVNFLYIIFPLAAVTGIVFFIIRKKKGKKNDRNSFV